VEQSGRRPKLHNPIVLRFRTTQFLAPDGLVSTDRSAFHAWAHSSCERWTGWLMKPGLGRTRNEYGCVPRYSWASSNASRCSPTYIHSLQMTTVSPRPFLCTLLSVQGQEPAEIHDIAAVGWSYERWTDASSAGFMHTSTRTSVFPRLRGASPASTLLSPAAHLSTAMAVEAIPDPLP
jgi:hypothetical protein